MPPAPPSASLIEPAIADFLEAGVWITAATRDDALRPEITCVFGLKVDRDARRVIAYVPDALAAATVRNLSRSPEIAINATEPGSCKSYQLKGRVERLRPASDEERWIIERHRAQLFALLATLTVSNSVTRHIASWPATAIELALRDLFNQTPGPRAGERVEGQP